MSAAKRRIFITGSESFVGRELVTQCQGLDIEVFGVDRVRLSDIEYNFQEGDIRSSNFADFIPESIDAVVHLASLSRDPDCRGKSYECFDVNVLGTLNVLRASRTKKVKQFIFASSEWVYGEFKEGEVKDEESPIDITKLTSEYAFSKLVSEVNLRQEYKLFPIDTTIIRFGIIYGPRRNNWSAVETLVSAVKNRFEVKIGSLKTGRRFLHVADIVGGIIKSIGLEGFKIINLSANNVITLGEIIKTAERILGRTVQIIEANPTVVSIRNPSNRRAKELLGWRPEIELETGLETLLPFL